MIPTCSDCYNSFLNGGFKSSIITGIYGPAASGKTLSCILAMLSPHLKDKKIIYIDSEKGFSCDRPTQIMPDTDALKKTLFLHKNNFHEIKDTCQKISDTIDEKFGLIIVDTISYPYRMEIARKADMKQLNNDFSETIGHLSAVSKRLDIPVILTSQVTDDFQEKDKVNPIGGIIFKNRCKCLIEIRRLNQNNRALVMVKHPDLEQHQLDEKVMKFKIVREGIQESE